MVCTCNTIAAIRPHAPLVPKDAEVIVLLDAKQLHAVVHEEVFTPRSPRQFFSTPIVPTVKVCLHCLSRVSFEGAVNHGEVLCAWILVAVHKVIVWARCLGEVLPYSPRQHNCIRISFHRPVVVGITAILFHGLPQVHEEQSVCCRVVLRLPYRCLLKPDGVHRGPVWPLSQKCASILAEDGILITGENSSTSTYLFFYQAKFVGGCHHDLKTKEGRSAPCCRRCCGHGDCCCGGCGCGCRGSCSGRCSGRRSSCVHLAGANRKRAVLYSLGICHIEVSSQEIAPIWQ
mmetsp:Transcript_36102/g.71421  ORF Transcript_36102/g.71421 Transcript_36102/m.71421 type:complete len:288 (-) Transcript_36102:2151-3014(-)